MHEGRVSVAHSEVHFDPGIGVILQPDSLSFQYGEGIFGPVSEMRRLDAIRASLSDPACSGPDPVYGIAMDVGKVEHRADLERRYLLFGVVAYAAGQLGHEPVRSQGHVHAIAPHSGWSTPELFEIWEGRAVIYAQEFAEKNPGRCIAVSAGPGDQVVVPPGWAHCAVNADPNRRMVFGAWCERQYGFVYDGIRAFGGLAWFPFISAGRITWKPNLRYAHSELRQRAPRAYPELGLKQNSPIYAQYEQNPEAMQWVSEPALLKQVWKTFEP
jgi:glucose-6-phosphate isomerase, archaeal